MVSQSCTDISSAGGEEALKNVLVRTYACSLFTESWIFIEKEYWENPEREAVVCTTPGLHSVIFLSFTSNWLQPPQALSHFGALKLSQLKVAQVEKVGWGRKKQRPVVRSNSPGPNSWPTSYCFLWAMSDRSFLRCVGPPHKR